MPSKQIYLQPLVQARALLVNGIRGCLLLMRITMEIMFTLGLTTSISTTLLLEQKFAALLLGVVVPIAKSKSRLIGAIVS